MNHSTILRPVLLACLFLLAAVAMQAQPQWRFHLAFEDGTGARDTIWFVYDTTATQGWGPGEVDHGLGEGGVTMDLGVFNVWMWNWDGDSTKTLAYPYTVFPWHGEVEMHSFNYQYPITIRWDRSLFHAEYLPNPDSINTAIMNGQYFYWYGNMPFPGVHSLLEEDSVVVLDLGEPLFPTALYVNHHTNTTGISGRDRDPLNIYQENDRLQVSVPGGVIQEMFVLDLSGRIVHGTVSTESVGGVALHAWPAGLYIVRVRTSTNTWYHGKFIKVAP